MANEPGRSEAAAGLATSIVASSLDAIVGITRTGEISSCNPAAARLYGYVADEVIGLPADVLVPEDRRVAEAGLVRQILAGEEVPPYRTERVRQDGSTVAVSLTMSPILDAAGSVVGAAVVSRKASDQQDARDRYEARVDRQRTDIQDAQDRFQVGMDAGRAKERVQVQDAQDRFEVGMDAQRAKERLQVQDAEDRFRTRMEAEWSRERVQVQNVDERAQLQRAEDRFQIRMVAERARERLLVQDAEDRFQVGMDAERAKERGLVQDAEDRFQVGVDADRAEAQDHREQLQGSLQQSQRLEVLGQLAGGVAHDFNNLLAVILNYAAFVIEDLAGRPDPGLEAIGRDVAQIQRAAERAASLTHQLLAFARREVVQPQVLDVNVVVTEVEQLLRRTIGEDVRLETTLAEGLWPVLVDAGQLEQVLVNLAVNSRDAMVSGGTLSIDTANLTVEPEFVAAGSAMTAGRYIRLRISDTGAGMPAHVIEHAFEPFFTTKPDGTGTGLGLATVYGIVMQAEGVIDVLSCPGVGTTFTIMIPVTDVVAEAVAETPSFERTPEGETVLIVEDEGALREVTQRIFAANGYRALTAASGPEAIELATHHAGAIHLLVTDVVMPNMLGKEVAEKIRKIKPEIEVLYMSGYAQPILASQGRLDPGTNLLEKPFSAKSLIEKAARILKGFETRPGDDVRPAERALPDASGGS